MKDIPAVFVSSAYEDTGLVTDVFAFQNGVFQSVTMREAESPVSTVRSYYVYASDIDGDGLIELPQILPLPSAEGSDENDSAISWYNLDLNQFCITRGAEADGVHGYAFSQWEDGRRTELIFTIYAFSGENRNESASADGRFILAEKGDITYAAKLGTGKWAEELSADRLRDMFHFIHIDWNSGET